MKIPKIISQEQIHINLCLKNLLLNQIKKYQKTRTNKFRNNEITRANTKTIHEKITKKKIKQCFKILSWKDIKLVLRFSIIFQRF